MVRVVTVFPLLVATACTDPLGFDDTVWPCARDTDCPDGLICFDRPDGGNDPTGTCGEREPVGAEPVGGDDPPPRDGGPPPPPEPVSVVFCEVDEETPPWTDWWLETNVAPEDVAARMAERNAFPTDLELDTITADWRFDLVLEDNLGPDALEFTVDTSTRNVGGDGWTLVDVEVGYMADMKWRARTRVRRGGNFWHGTTSNVVLHIEDPDRDHLRITDLEPHDAPPDRTDWEVVMRPRLPEHSQEQLVLEQARDSMVDLLRSRDTRPYDIAYHEWIDRHSAIIERCPGPRTWWVDHETEAELLERAARDGARIVRLERKDAEHFVALLENNLGPVATHVHRRVRDDSDARTGYAAARDDELVVGHLRTEPIPAGAHAFTWIGAAVDAAIATNAIDPADTVAIYEPGAPCPGDATANREPIADALRIMRDDRDPARAKALARLLGGPPAVQQWLDVEGLEGSSFVGFVGCADNTTTLADLIAVTPVPDAAAIEATLETIVDAEGAALDPAQRTAFVTAMSVATATDEGLSPADTHRSIAGRLEIPRCDPQRTEVWTFAMFLDRTGRDADVTFDIHQAELLRVPIREALAGDLSCL